MQVCLLAPRRSLALAHSGTLLYAARRKKKLRCNRADPCAPCVSRGEGHLCSWEGAEPLYKARDEADTQELRDQVARLESLVRYLTSQRPDDPSGDYDSAIANDEPGSPVADHVDNFPSKAREFDSAARRSFHGGEGTGGGGTSNPSRGNSFNAQEGQTMHTPKSALAIDMRANDLVEGLAQLAIREFVVLENSGSDAWAPGNARGLDFLDEAEQFVETMPQHFGVSQKPAFSIPVATPRSTASSPATMATGAGAARSFGMPAMSSYSASVPSEAASSPGLSSYAAPSPLSPRRSQHGRFHQGRAAAFGRAQVPAVSQSSHERVPLLQRVRELVRPPGAPCDV